MPEFNIPKKRTKIDSVDGFLPARNGLPKSTTHKYYRTADPRTAGPRRPLNTNQPSRRRPHHTDMVEPELEAEEPTPKIGDFDNPNTNIFDEKLMKKSEDSIIGRRRGGKAKDSKDSKKDKTDKKKGRLRTWWGNRTLKFKVGLIAGIILLVLAGLLGYRLYSFLNSVFGRGVGNSNSAALNDKVKPEDLNTEGDGRLNILLLGRGGVENEAPDLTDTLMIASIDLENQQTSLLSIPRDTWVTVKGSGMKINAAYSSGKQSATYRGKPKDEAEDEGVKTAIETVRSVAGVPIHKYVLTDYKAFRDVVNALGGVDINVKSSIYDNFTGWKFSAGQQTMNGDKALQYARTRHGSTRGDFDRNENQRQLLVAMRQKATSTGIVANPVRLNSLANAVQKNIRTDLSIDEAKTLFEKTKQMQDSSIVSLDLAKKDEPLVQTGNVNGQSIVRPVAGVSDFSKIRAYARTNMMDPYLKQEAPTVALYNGSGKAGIATIIGDVMAGYGYKILTKETSQATQAKTLVVKMTKTDKPFTSRFLGIRFATAISSTLPSNVVPPKEATTDTTAAATPEPDYIIIIGTDYKQQTGPTW